MTKFYLSCLGLLFVSSSAFAQTNLVSTTPPRNGVAARASNVGLTFTQAIAAGSETNIRVFGSQVRGLRTGTYSGVGSANISFDPTLDFAPGEQISVSVPSTVVDVAGIGVRSHTYQFTAAAGPGSAVFSGTTAITVGNNPNSIVTADINNDGRLDIVVAQASTMSASVRLGNAQGGFTSAFDAYIGTTPSQIILADVNNDGRLDVLTANANNNTVSIRLGNGQGSFSGFTDTSVGSTPVGLAAADLNNDGKLDLVTANATANTVSVLLGNGSGGFTAVAAVPVGTTPSSIVAADVNNDGNMDLLVANSGSNTVSVRLGSGAGTFTGTTALSTGSQPSSLTAADITNDGNLDVLVANRSSNTVSVYQGTGNGSFSASNDIAVGADVRQVVAADVNGDGNLDVLTANATANTVSVRQGNGAGSFTALPDVIVGNSPVSLATGDVNGDTALDIVTANSTAASVSVRLNQGPPLISGFTPVKALPGASVTIRGLNFTGATAVTFAGMNAPGVVVNSATSITVPVPAGATSGLLTVTTPVAVGTSSTAFRVQFPVVSTTPPRSGVAARTSNVGLTFTQAIAAGSETNIRVFGSQLRGLRTGTYSGAGSASISFDPTLDFAPGEQISVSVPSTVVDAAGREALPTAYQFTAAVAPSTGIFTSAPDFAVPVGNWALAVGDVNNDGIPDLVSDNIYTASASVWIGNGQGGFTAGNIIPLSGSPSVVLADVNNDHKLDLIAATGNSNLVNVRLGDGQGGFTGSTDLLVFPARGVVAADINNDGNVDLVCHNNGFSTQLGDGLGGFVAGPSYTSSNALGNFTMADMNNDGVLDIVVATFNNNGPFETVETLLGDGNGNFTASMPFGVVVERLPGTVIAADINNDGNRDILCTAQPNNATQTGVVCIRYGNGLGGYTGTTNVVVGERPGDLDVVDLDGDGDLDFLTTNFFSKNISVRFNDGLGNFSGTTTIPLGRGLSASLVTADFTGDGSLDFAVLDQDLGTIRIRLNQALPLATAGSVKTRSFTAYPNPGRVGKAITIQLPSYTIQDAVLRITDIVGRTIYEQRVASTTPGTLTLPPATFKQPGTYIIQLIAEEKTSTTRVLITE